MPGKAIWRLRIQENHSAAGALPGPRWGSIQRSRKPLVGGEGWLSPPQEPHPPLLAVRASPLLPHSKISSDVVVNERMDASQYWILSSKRVDTHVTNTGLLQWFSQWKSGLTDPPTALYTYDEFGKVEKWSSSWSPTTQNSCISANTPADGSGFVNEWPTERAQQHEPKRGQKKNRPVSGVDLSQN